jgi:hypothetical protein
MRKLIVAILVGILFVSTNSRFVYAGSSVIINEFAVEPETNQWVELYNDGTEAIDISGWTIDDNGGSEKLAIPQGTIIEPGTYKIFESNKFNFNKASPDEVRLFQGEELVDNYQYDSSPGSNRSYGRESDADGTWVTFIQPSKGTSNNPSFAQAVPTDTPLPQPTSTKAPTPTKVPTPTKTPTPTKIPTPTKTLTNKQTSVSTADEAIRITYQPGRPTPMLSIPATESAVLGESTKEAKLSKNPTPNKKPTKQTSSPILVKDSNTQNKVVIGSIALIAAILCIGCAILLVRKRKLWNK